MSNQGTLESIAKEIPKTLGHAEKIMSDTIDKGRHLFTQAMENSEEATQKAYGQAKETVESAVHNTSAAVKKYPLQSLLIGFSLGCLLGFTLRASRKWE